jgi:hypothetical protein
MKPQSIMSQLVRGSALLAVLALALGASMSCMTTYDAQGRPVQSVDPGVALAGAAAAGIAGYAIANNNNHYHNGYYYGGHYHSRPYYGHRGHYYKDHYYR